MRKLPPLRIVAGTYGGVIEWEVEPGVNLSSATVLGAELRGPTGVRKIAASVNVSTRQVSYTIQRDEIRDPGEYTVEVTLQMPTFTHRTTCEFIAYHKKSPVNYSV